MSELVLPESSKRSYENLHFAPARIHNGVLYASGVIGTGADGKLPDSVEDEFRNAWNAVGVVLKEAGMNYGDIFEFTSYHVGLQGHIGSFMKVKDEFLQAPYPAWTAIGITELAIPGASVEIRVQAG